ncbi:LytTR family DNA-binding domain-containing protein [Ruegeria arenilitoris]|uniref:LytTR family DNA-binding domain-containing protein n=1 Tax=Ruegeria arenilitoris TaxID=1173585 RepID=UPI00147FBDA5|nr:LytTR family DNA-binding domain-containing protein [Ruegeria arenilitoris]
MPRTHSIAIWPHQIAVLLPPAKACLRRIWNWRRTDGQLSGSGSKQKCPKCWFPGEHISLLTKAELAVWLRGLMKDKVFISAYAVVFLALVIVERGHAVPNISQVQHALYVLAWVIAFYAFYFFAGPTLFYWSIRNSICVFWTTLGSYLIILFLKTFIVTHLLAGGSSLGHAVLYYLTSAFVSTVVTYAIFLHFRAQAVKGFGYDPLKYLFRRPPRQMECPIQMKLDEANRGPLLMIEAQNQYVSVTTENGTQLIRMTLKSATQSLDPDAGLLIHRSRWLSKKQIDELVYKNGNPYVVTPSGNAYSISRKMVSKVKETIEQRKAQSFSIDQTGPATRNEKAQC